MLEAGKAWSISEWIREHSELALVETAGFFEWDASEDQSRWGRHLNAFLSWGRTTGKPFGYPRHNEVDADVNETEWVIEDVRHEVRALLAAANERLLGKPEDVDTRVQATIWRE